MQTTQVDQEAVALARCYALLLQKARERRARLAAETAVSNDVKRIEIDEGQDEQDVSHNDDK